jgi:hypothetical protein
MLDAALTELRNAAATTSSYLPGPATTNGPCIRLIGELRSLAVEDDWEEPAHLDAVAHTINELVHHLGAVPEGLIGRDTHPDAIGQLASVAHVLDELGIRLDEVHSRLDRLAVRLRRAEPMTPDDSTDLLFGAAAVLRGVHVLLDRRGSASLR